MVLAGQGGLCRVEAVHLRLQALQEEALSNGVDDVGDVVCDLSHFPVGLGFIGRFFKQSGGCALPDRLCGIRAEIRAQQLVLEAR